MTAIQVLINNGYSFSGKKLSTNTLVCKLKGEFISEFDKGMAESIYKKYGYTFLERYIKEPSQPNPSLINFKEFYDNNL